MFRNCKKCYCMNNEYKNLETNNNCQIMEERCNNINSYENDTNDCNCGFDEEYNVFTQNPMLAQSYVPWQYMDRTFKPCVGLKMGTIFPELVSPYMPCQSMRTNEFIRNSNKIGKGCNKCC